MASSYLTLAVQASFRNEQRRYVFVQLLQEPIWRPSVVSSRRRHCTSITVNCTDSTEDDASWFPAGWFVYLTPPRIAKRPHALVDVLLANFS
jgi:hypothetical protein